jgi:hypothetical protein
MTAIPILSLVVAALAVFVGPIISWRVAKRQITATLATFNKQIIAPMRQTWINNLRDLLSELTSRALHYNVAGFEERTDEEYQHLTLLEHKITLMLNPREDDHQNLERLIRQMVDMIGTRTMADDEKFYTCHKAVVALARDVLKRERDALKEPIPKP